MTLEELYKNNKKKYLHILNGITHNSSISEDILQEAFCKAVEKQLQYDSDKGSLNTWFIKILFSTLWNEKRKSKKNLNCFSLELFSEDVFCVTDTDPVVDCGYLSNKLHRVVIHLYVNLGYSSQEISNLFNITDNNVRKILERFRKNIRQT